LKSARAAFKSRIPDAAYSKMAEAIEKDQAPSIFALHYDQEEWRVRNLLLLPRFAYSLKDVLKRTPLSSTARRHGWVGCDILLRSIPQRARIPVVLDGVPISPREVRREFERLKPLRRMRPRLRGWTLDVMLIVDSLAKVEFDLSEVYAHEEKLRALHFRNRHVRPKIRQPVRPRRPQGKQLQRLRDLGFVEFLGGGRYRLG
jgi:type II restriction enzyme